MRTPGALRWSETVFGSGFTGGVRVAAGDITGDGIPDAIVAPGAGHAPRVKVLDGVTGDEIGGALGASWRSGRGRWRGVRGLRGRDGDGAPGVIAAALTSAGRGSKRSAGWTGRCWPTS